MISVGRPFFQIRRRAKKGWKHEGSSRWGTVKINSRNEYIIFIDTININMNTSEYFSTEFTKL